MIITSLAAKDLQHQAVTLENLAQGLDPDLKLECLVVQLNDPKTHIYVQGANVRNALIQAAGTIRFLLDALQTNTMEFPGEEQLVSATIAAQRRGFSYLCFGCLQGFNYALCPRCANPHIPGDASV